MKFVAISDTHGDHRKMSVPAADVIIHAGDMTANGTLGEVQDFIAWFDSLKYAHKILVAGNHDWYLDQNPADFQSMLESTSIVYLNDSGIEIDGIRLWGSPITPEFYHWAFQRKVGTDINRHWELIPADTNVLVTHGPPFGIMDQVPEDPQWDGVNPSEDQSYNSGVDESDGENAAHFVNAGCPGLLERVREISPDFHVFGHIHEGYGVHQERAIRFINVATMNGSYQLQNMPVLFEFPVV